MRWKSLYALLAAIALAGCSGSSAHTATGVVTGKFIMTGGPMFARDDALSGVVKLTDSHGKTVAKARAADGTFRIRAQPGSYSLWGTSPTFNGGRERCAAPGPSGKVAVVRVKSGRRVSFDVLCYRM